MKVIRVHLKNKIGKMYIKRVLMVLIAYVVLYSTAGCSKVFPRLLSPQQQNPGTQNLSYTGGVDVSPAANKVIPSVVGITIVKAQDGKTLQGVGSGIIVDSTGYILTNNHVAGGTLQSMTVSLYDGRDVPGTTVWTDPSLDLALVKIGVGGLPAAALGDSKNIRIGQPAVAIGNPLGLTFQRTVTAGVISAVNRTIELAPGQYMEDLLQTDASINPGNSGGPLTNINGEIIGINTIKVTTAEGLGFAIPINVAKPVIDKIKSGGTFKTPSLAVIAVDGNMGKLLNFTSSSGVYVLKCTDGGSAHRNGIANGDTVISVDGTPVNSAIELKEALYRAGTGNTVRFRVKNPLGKERDVNIKLEGL